MRERLIANWLDKLNERGYQPVFCQALSARGQVVVHSTRHGPMEFGKDVVAKDAAGQFHAYQLKGNPGTRLSIGQWNVILPQINALMQQPVEPPLSPRAQLAKPYLVTNGEVDEEVHAAIGGLNALADGDGRPTLQLISRGQLLGEYLKPIADEVWPASTDIEHHILECWGLNGRDFLSVEPLYHSLMSALPFEEPPRTRQGVTRALYGVAISTEICLRRYVEAENYVSVILGRALFLSAAYCFLERARKNPKQYQEFITLIWASMADDFVSLVDNLKTLEDRNYFEEKVYLQFVYHGPRLMLLKAMLSSMALALEKQPDAFRNVIGSAMECRDFIYKFVNLSVVSRFLNGEYVVSQFLLVYWYCCCNSGSAISDQMVKIVLNTMMFRNASKNKWQKLPNPYYLMSCVLEELTTKMLNLRQNFEERESFMFQLWTALPLFGLLIRRNMKSTSRDLFSELTRFMHYKTVIKNHWSFGLFRTPDAEEYIERLEFPGKWADWVERTRAKKKLSIPKGLLDDPLTLSLFLIACPFRVTEEAVYHLDERFVGNWHVE